MLGPQEIGLGVRESVPDVARVLSSYVQGIMARVFEHKDVLELAEYSRVPVINGLSDDYHPCQALADILTIREHFGRLEGLKLAFVGDGNNVAASVALACAHFGVSFSIATPEGYEMKASIRDQANAVAGRNGSALTMHTHPQAAVADADVVYTDTWVSMGQEAEAAERAGEFGAFQVNDEFTAVCRCRNAIVMHCLPAHRGDEITDDVMDGRTVQRCLSRRKTACTRRRLSSRNLLAVAATQTLRFASTIPSRFKLSRRTCRPFPHFPAAMDDRTV